MKKLRNVLIVEDREDWIGFFERAVQHADYPFRTARQLGEAMRLLKEMAFAVAFVDIRLDERDEENVDGLRVLEEIQNSGDQTSSIVVTGYGTVSIARDALKKYNAFDVFEKTAMEPQIVGDLLRRGTDAYAERAKKAGVEVQAIFRGKRIAWDWENEMLTTLHPKDGIPGLYHFLDAFFESFLPVVPKTSRGEVMIHGPTSTAHGLFWSRAVGKPLLVLYGTGEAVNKVTPPSFPTEAKLLGMHSIGQVLRDYSYKNLRGLVLELRGEERANFSD